MKTIDILDGTKHNLAWKREHKRFGLDDAILFRRGVGGKLIVVLLHYVQRLVELFQKDFLMGDHMGIRGTLEKIRRLYWWRNMKKDVEDVVHGCKSCSQFKGDLRKTESKGFQPAEGPGSRINIDHLVPLRLIVSGCS